MQFSQAMIALAASLTWSQVSAAPAAGARTSALHKRDEGYWQVDNRCTFTIYYTSVNQEGTVVDNGYVEPGTKTLGSFSGDQDGLSVKLCLDADGCANPYQFETTVDQATQQVFYDLSAVDGDPFIDYERAIYPTDNSGPTEVCNPGDESCAYNFPSDDTKTHAAALSAVIVAQICS